MREWGALIPRLPVERNCNSQLCRIWVSWRRTISWNGEKNSVKPEAYITRWRLVLVVRHLFYHYLRYRCFNNAPWEEHAADTGLHVRYRGEWTIWWNGRTNYVLTLTCTWKAMYQSEAHGSVGNPETHGNRSSHRKDRSWLFNPAKERRHVSFLDNLLELKT